MAKNLSTFKIAELLHVDPGSIANWIDQGLLVAHRTPGGHRRVRVEDLVKFLREHKMPVPADLGTAAARVLVVDDEPAITQMITRAINATHPEYEVAQAHDGFRAGSLVATMLPDVVILDLRMPGMDGYEVCRLIKSQDATRHTEIIAMTAYPTPDNEERIRQCGAKVCMPKPLDLDALLKEINASI
jgi:excisionase family DNA binding protein